MDLLSSIGGGTGLVLVVAANAYRKSRQAQKAATPPKPRSIDPAAYGLSTGDQTDQTRGAADPEGDAVTAAVLSGDWRTGAAYLDAAGTHWDLRWYRLGKLAEAASEDDSWLRAWQAERPGDPSAALVHADSLIILAGKVRGAKTAAHTTEDQFEGFHRLLRESVDACRHAAELAPQDPSPLVAQISIALGLGWSHEQFRALWAEIVARDPYHFGAHRTALQYWCAKWRGSHELMHDFADRAAAAAPPGHLLATLPLYAIFEQENRDRSEDIYQLPETAAAVDHAWRTVIATPANHHRLPEVRHLLANALTCSGRYAEAVEQFRLIGPYCGAVPWSYYGNPLKAFGGTRATAVLGWEDAGRPQVPAT